MSFSIIIFISVLVIMACGIMSGMRPWRRVASYETRPTGQQALPKISIVAYVLRDEDDLTSYVDRLLSQDYPDFEVILVCDASAETTAVLSEKFENIENLKLTFIPPGSHNLSRRKLAQTLGIKRASGDVVLTTATSVIPASDKWLRSMAEPFADHDINIVCGYVHPEFSDFTGAAKWYRQMDGVLT
ncbi:MAG: glycosyltransferase, partial [Muribaculaceae bacterium]|nr:glycosyltransferase [Muribaculaceae bacterium]